MRRKYRNILRTISIYHPVIFLSVAICVSPGKCKKFVQIGAPNSQVVTASVFVDDNAATAAVTSIYSQMQSESWTMSQNSGLLGDELLSGSTSGSVQPFFTNTLLATMSPIPGPWASAYNYIYQCNAVMEGLQSYEGTDATIRRKLTGEVKFLRAFWYFYLTNCYGDVPLATTTDYKINSVLSRTPRVQVYQQIIRDLRDAQSMLDTNFIDASDTTVTIDRIRPTKWAASALLARVYLYTDSFANSEIQASLVIASGRFGLVKDLNSVFLKNSQEAIWQLGTPSPSSWNTTDAYYFVLTAAPAGYGASVNTCTTNPSLLNSFESGDNRKTNWIGSIHTAMPDTTYYFPYKYKNISSNIIEYTMMLRLAEQYLIRAEARVRQNKDLDKAVLEDINPIRERAGLPDYSGSLAQDTLLAVIAHERRSELFVEWGHRWFDLIRTGKIDAVMDTIAPQKGTAWRPELALYPIPQSEINIDFNLSQNSGY